MLDYDQTRAGFGKSYTQLKRLAQSKRQTIHLVPSIDLAKEQQKLLQLLNPHLSVKVIHGDSVTGSTTHAFCNEIMQSSASVIISTHATFKLALFRGLSMFNEYDLSIDESMSFHKAHALSIYKSSFDLITSYLNFVSADESRYSVTVKNGKRTQVEALLAGSEHDDLFEASNIKDFFTFVLSASHTTYIPKFRLENFISIDEALEKRTTLLTAGSIINASVLEQFNSVKILSADFTLSESYYVMKNAGFTFNDVSMGPVVNERENVFIHYYIDENWTAAKRDNSDPNKNWFNNRGHGIQHYVIQDAMSKIGNARAIANCNSKYEYLFSIPVVNTPHGLNDFDTVANAICVSSANADSSEIHALNDVFGVNRAEIDFERNVMSCNQFCNRTIIRNRDMSDIRVDLFVVDKRRADYLKAKFPNATVVRESVQQIESIVERNRSTVIPRAVVKTRSYKESQLKSGIRLKPRSYSQYVDIMNTYYSQDTIIANN
ncbi:hypothetical protein ACUN9V_09530 [Salinicola sp. V024]|uniref:hypothetical protein n=1 Tax=Salinicola sp. V024 TaxID=3459609 RepID=UPI00404504CC